MINCAHQTVPQEEGEFQSPSSSTCMREKENQNLPVLPLEEREKELSAVFVCASLGKKRRLVNCLASISSIRNVWISGLIITTALAHYADPSVESKVSIFSIWGLAYCSHVAILGFCFSSFFCGKVLVVKMR